jgi:hypothetical protein
MLAFPSSSLVRRSAFGGRTDTPVPARLVVPPALALDLHHPMRSGDGVSKEGEMASNLFQSYERTLRRMHMMNLVDAASAARSDGFRASLVVNAHTGLPIEPSSNPRPTPGMARITECHVAL